MTRRNLTIDNLRIVMMFLIIFHHFSLYATTDFTTNDQLLDLTIFVGKNIANLCNIFFIILFGYFTSDSFKNKKFIKTLMLLLGYHFAIELAFVSFNGFKSFDFFNFVIRNNYWFVTFYLIYLVAGPFLKRFMNKLDRKQSVLFVTTAFAISILPSYLLSMILSEEHFLIIKTFVSDKFIKYFPHFVIGLYLNKYKDSIYKSYFLMAVGVIPLIFAIINRAKGIPDDANIWLSLENLFIFGSTSIAIVIIKWAFNKSDDKIMPFSAYVAPSILAIYLIHENAKMRSFLWKNCFSINKLQNLYFIKIFLIVIFVFSFCFVIDAIRRRLVKMIKTKV